MLTKIGVAAALLGTVGAAVVGGGTAMAAEPWAPARVVVSAPRRVVVAPRPVVVAAPAPIVTTVGYGYGGARYREEARLARLRREAEARRHAEWLRHHNHYGRR